MSLRASLQRMIITTAWLTTACSLRMWFTTAYPSSLQRMPAIFDFFVFFWVVPRSHLRLRLNPSILTIIFSVGVNCKEEVALFVSFGVSVWFYWLFWWGVGCLFVSLEATLVTSWFCWIFLDPEPSGIGSVLNSGIWPSCLTFPAFWTCPVSLIVLIVYDLFIQKSTPNVNLFGFILPCG